MGLNNTVSAERVHIGFFGMRNAGKSSLVNAINEVVNNSGSKNVQMTTTVLCNSTSSESAITFSESADNYDLIIGTVEFLYKSGSKEGTYI